MCELEAYREAPFQAVSSADGLFSRRGEEGYYNGWGSDNPYGGASPLVIEPEQTRADTLAPTLIVPESPWAQTACTIDQSRSGRIGLKNGFPRLDVSTEGELRESKLTNLVTGEGVSTPGAAGFRIRTAQGELTPADFHVVRADTSGSDADASQLRVDPDEKKEANNNWVPDDLPVTASVNGVGKTVHAFRTGGNREKGLTRCFFIAIEGETKPGGSNAVEVSLPIQQGLVFSGAYLDLPTSRPATEQQIFGRPPAAGAANDFPAAGL